MGEEGHYIATYRFKIKRLGSERFEVQFGPHVVCGSLLLSKCVELSGTAERSTDVQLLILKDS